MTRTIQNYIMAIILAGAMILALGVTLQTAYAEDETSEVDYVADYVIHGMSTNGCVLPGCEYQASAVLIQDGQILENLPEGATVEWSYGVMEAQPRPDDFIIDPDSGEDVTIQVPELPEAVPAAALPAHSPVMAASIISTLSCAPRRNPTSTPTS